MKRVFLNPKTNEYKEVKVGYSWTVFFWGCIPMLFRKDWATAGICFVAGLVLNSIFISLFNANMLLYPSTLMYIVIAYYYNKYYADNLLKQGYIEQYPQNPQHSQC